MGIWLPFAVAIWAAYKAPLATVGKWPALLRFEYRSLRFGSFVPTYAAYFLYLTLDTFLGFFPKTHAWITLFTAAVSLSAGFIVLWAILRVTYLARSIGGALLAGAWMMMMLQVIAIYRFGFIN